TVGQKIIDNVSNIVDMKSYGGQHYLLGGSGVFKFDDISIELTHNIPTTFANFEILDENVFILDDNKHFLYLQDGNQYSKLYAQITRPNEDLVKFDEDTWLVISKAQQRISQITYFENSVPSSGDWVHSFQLSLLAFDVGWEGTYFDLG